MTGLTYQVNRGIELERPSPNAGKHRLHLPVRRQPFTFGGGASVAVGLGLAVD